ncbi:MAG: MFS transporter [Pseudomonadota bacterium]|nr:MFS transporter [Pseudomonadota bacterium]
MAKQQNTTIIELILSLGLVSTTSAIFFPATVAIATYFKQPVASIQHIYAWVFFVKFITIPFYYYGSMHYGRLRLLTVGSVLLILGFVGCNLASPTNFDMFRVSMLIMALGASSSAVISKILIKSDLSREALHNYAAVTIATPLMVFPLMVIISSFLTSYASWHYVTWFTVMLILLNFSYLILIQKVSNQANTKVRVQQMKSFLSVRHLAEEMSFLLTNALSNLLLFTWMTVAAYVFLKDDQITPIHYALLLLITNFIPSLISVFFSRRLFLWLGIHLSMILVLLIRLFLGVCLIFNTVFFPHSDMISLFLCSLGVLTINTSAAGTLTGSSEIINRKLGALSSYLCMQLAMLGGFTGSLVASYLHAESLFPVGVSMILTAVVSLLIVVLFPKLDQKRSIVKGAK